MSKMDMARGMSLDSDREREKERHIPGRDLSESEILEKPVPATHHNKAASLAFFIV